LIQLAKASFPPAIRDAASAEIARILAGGKLMLGPWKDRFESGFAKYVGVPHAISLNSCTTALTICLSHGGARGHDVLVPSGSFVTDVSSVIFAGGNPILVDMDPETLAIDLEDAARKITPRTRAMIWVHLTGVISKDFEKIAAFAKKHGLYLIEDAAHALGSEINGRMAGSLADASCFSFYPTKTLSTGAGGMITTRDDALRRYAEQMRLFGKESETGEIIHLGNDWFLDEIRACIGALALTDLERQVARRREIADRYHAALANQPGIRLVNVPVNCKPGWYQYPVFLADTLNHGEVVAALKEQHKIECKAIYRPTHKEKVFEHLDDGSLKNTEATLRRSLCLPMHAELSDQDVDTVAAALIVECRARL